MTSKHRYLWIGLIGLTLAIWACCIMVCLYGVMALLVLKRADALKVGRAATRTALPTPDSTVPSPSITPTREPIPSLTKMATRTSLLTSTPTYTPSTVPFPTSTRTPTHTSTPTHTPTRASSLTRSATHAPAPTRAPTPTPIVCEGLDDLGEVRIVPGQRFECTISQETLTDQVRNYPDVPCNDARITLDDAQIRLECWLGIKMSATGVVKAEECRLVLEITEGTMGFKSVVQDLIDAQLNVIPYDAICVEQVTVDDGEIEISGYGR